MQIQALSDDGFAAREIGRRLGVNFKRIQWVAAREKIRLGGGSNGCRRVQVWLPKPIVERLDALATEAEISRSAMMGRIVRSELEDGVAVARRRLGKLALPKRRYVKREAGGGQ